MLSVGQDCGIAKVEDPLGNHCTSPGGGWEQGGSRRGHEKWSDFPHTLKEQPMWILERLDKLLMLGGTLEII